MAEPFSDEEIKKFETNDGWEEVILRSGSVGSMRNRIRVTIAVLQTQGRADCKRIEELEKFKEATLSIGIEEVEICMGCGREGCGNCPAGVTYTVKNTKLAAQAATIERLREEIKAIKEGD